MTDGPRERGAEAVRADGNRATQLWMLDPHREPPPTLTGPLRAEAGRPDLHQLCHWAAFTHQGNPAPGRPISLA
ncbi:hypothetical protein [Streptomyces sp. NK08203]|uniref:hypothetical protein n=1 Tax=Streptomyces sp. NK08203 TaxID=2821730 RepID=UPI001C2D67CD|nr:hypothetical protein [Streptomyces sp. NK08203]